MSSFPATGQLDPSATISRAFDIYKAQAGVLLPLAFGLYAIQAVISIIATGSVLALVLASVVTTILGIIYQGMIVELVRDLEDGTLDSSPLQLAQSIVPVIWPLFAVGLITAIAAALGLIAIIVGSLVVLTFFSMVGPVTVLERPGILAAFSRSIALVKGNAWPVFALILFSFVLAIIAGLVAGAIGSAAGTAGLLILSWITRALIAPITALITAVAYLRLREVHGEAPLPTGVATPKGPLGV